MRNYKEALSQDPSTALALFIAGLKDGDLKAQGFFDQFYRGIKNKNLDTSPSYQSLCSIAEALDLKKMTHLRILFQLLTLTETSICAHFFENDTYCSLLQTHLSSEKPFPAAEQLACYAKREDVIVAIPQASPSQSQELSISNSAFHKRPGRNNGALMTLSLLQDPEHFSDSYSYFMDTFSFSNGYSDLRQILKECFDQFATEYPTKETLQSIGGLQFQIMRLFYHHCQKSEEYDFVLFSRVLQHVCLGKHLNFMRGTCFHLFDLDGEQLIVDPAQDKRLLDSLEAEKKELYRKSIIAKARDHHAQQSKDNPATPISITPEKEKEYEESVKQEANQKLGVIKHA